MIHAENPLSDNPGSELEQETPLEEMQEEIVDTFHVFKKYWNKAVVIFLGAHGLYGFIEALYFLFIEYPELDHLLKEHLIDGETVTQLTAIAIVLMITTFINVLMAMRLHKVRNEVAPTIELVLATVLIVATTYLREVIGTINLAGIVETFF